MTWDEIMKLGALLGIGVPLVSLIIALIHVCKTIITATRDLVAFFVRLETTLDKVITTHTTFTEKLEQLFEVRK